MLWGTYVAAAMAAGAPFASKGGAPGYCAAASRVAMRLLLQHTYVVTSRASATAACGALRSSRSSNSTPCCICCSKCGNHRWFSFLRDPQSLKRVLAELAAAEKAAEQHSNISSSDIEGDEKNLADPCPSSCEENEELCLHSSYSSCSNDSSISDSSSSNRVRAKSSSHDERDSDGPPPVQVCAEVVLSREQQMMLDEAEASAAAAAAADRQQRFLDSVAAAESTEGGLRGALQQSFDALLPPNVTAAAAAPTPSAAGGQHATEDAAGGSAASAEACDAGGFVWNETDEAVLTPAQRFYRDNRELLLQRAEQYLRGKQAAAAAAAAGGASAADEEEWDDAARTLEEDWKAYFNPVHKQPKGFRWPVADTTESAAAAAPPLDMEFRKGQYPSLEEFKCLLAQEGVKDVVCLNLEALSRRDLGLVALIGTCGTAAHCRRVSRLLRSIITSLEIPLVSDSCSCTSGSTRRNRARRSSSSSEWFVACLGPVSVHLMTAAARDYYDVERIWRSTGELQEQQQQAHEGPDEDLLLLPSTGEQEDMLQQHQRLVLQQLQQLQQKQKEQS